MFRLPSAEKLCINLRLRFYGDWQADRSYPDYEDGGQQQHGDGVVVHACRSAGTGSRRHRLR